MNLRTLVLAAGSDPRAQVATGAYASRAAVVRAALDAMCDLERRRDIDRAMQDGYRRVPPTAAEESAAIASLREAILEEPW